MKQFYVEMQKKITNSVHLNNKLQNRTDTTEAPNIIEMFYYFNLQKSIDNQRYVGRRLTMGYTDRLIRNANLHYRLAHAKDAALRQFEVG